jgi:hypothetical protein
LTKEFGPTAWTIALWVRQAERDNGKGDRGLTMPLTIGVFSATRARDQRFAVTFTLRLLLMFCGIIFTTCAIGDSAAEFTGLRSGVVFSDYSPLSSSAELLHRLLSPLNAAEVRKRLAQSAVALRDQPIDLAQEKLQFLYPRIRRPKVMGYWCSYRRGRTRCCREVGPRFWIAAA